MWDNSYSRCQEKQTWRYSVTCVLFGVNTESKGYRMSNPNKIIVSRNVAFDEDREWDWKFFDSETKLDWGKTIEIDENTVEEGKITEATTELVAETIEPVAENEKEEITEGMTKPIAETIEPVAGNNFPVALAPDLTIREGRNWHAPVWLADYNSGEGLSEEDEENMEFLMISDEFWGSCQIPKMEICYGWRNQIHWKKNQTWNLVVLPTWAKKIGVK